MERDVERGEGRAKEMGGRERGRDVGDKGVERE